MIDVPPAPLPSQEQAIEQRLVECGLDARGIFVKYEDYLQSIEVIIRPDSGATAEHFRCIRDSSDHEIVTFEYAEMHSAYSDYVTELARPQILETFKKSLQEKNLLKNFPERQNFASLEDYAKALEVHGKVAPGTALRVSGDSLTFDPPRENKSFADFSKRWSDLLAIVAYASTIERISFGFIGNAAVSDKQN